MWSAAPELYYMNGTHRSNYIAQGARLIPWGIARYTNNATRRPEAVSHDNEKGEDTLRCWASLSSFPLPPSLSPSKQSDMTLFSLSELVAQVKRNAVLLTTHGLHPVPPTT